MSNLRFDSLQKQINDAKKDCFSYIDLINFPETNKREYKTAIQVIEENIFNITEIKTINECTENEGQKKSIIQSLVYKIREKERNNKRRSEQFNKIDWVTGEDSEGTAITTNTCPHSEIDWAKFKTEFDKL